MKKIFALLNELDYSKNFEIYLSLSPPLGVEISTLCSHFSYFV